MGTAPVNKEQKQVALADGGITIEIADTEARLRAVIQESRAETDQIEIDVAYHNGL